MNDTQLKHFISLVKIGSFSKAEEKLNLTKTALKKQIDSLEKELDFPLFTRSHTGLHLTEPGKHFYKEINHLLSAYSTLLEECRSFSLHRKKIRIGIYTLSSTLNWYSKISTAANLEIEYVYLSGENLSHQKNLQTLKDRKIDFLEYEDNQLIYDHQLLFRQIETDHLCCIMHPDHPLSMQSAIRLEDLHDSTLHCWTSDSSATRALYNQTLKLNLHLNSTPYSKNTVLNLCHSGNIYILSSALASTFQPLCIIPIVPTISYHRGLAYLPENKALLDRLFLLNNPKL